MSSAGASSSKGRLYAIADIHISHKSNREAWSSQLTPHKDDSLILAGDVGESAQHMEEALTIATQNFKEVFWVPGNHELYTTPMSENPKRGEHKYQECVDICRRLGVHTPEDEWILWTGDGGPAIVALGFLLYDYTFRPAHLKSAEEALEWANEEGIKATDEALLHPDPYESRQQWCEALVKRFEAKLAKTRESMPHTPIIFVNHWPLREDLVFIPRIPRFSLWCGTKLTEDWHTKYNLQTVVSGHLHVRRTDWKDGTRFEEVSLGYPQQWEDAKAQGKDVNSLLREILPGPIEPLGGNAPTQFRRYG